MCVLHRRILYCLIARWYLPVVNTAMKNQAHTQTFGICIYDTDSIYDKCFSMCKIYRVAQNVVGENLAGFWWLIVTVQHLISSVRNNF